MTTRVRITNISDGSNHDINVNEVECQSYREFSDGGGKTVDFHTLKPDESIEVTIFGWQRSIVIVETSPGT